MYINMWREGMEIGWRESKWGKRKNELERKEENKDESEEGKRR